MTEPTKKLGIQELKDLATAVARTTNAIDGILADGVADWHDAGRFPQLLSGLKGFGDVDFEDILPEAGDIDDGEKRELAEHFKATLAIEGETAEEFIEAGFELLLEAIDAIKALRDIAIGIRDRLNPKPPAAE